MKQIYEISREKVTTFSRIEYLLNTHSFIDNKVVPLPEGGKPMNSKQLAELLAVQPSRVSEWKTEKHQISKYYRDLICFYFKCDEDFLLCRQALPSVPDQKTDFQKFIESQYYDLFFRLLVLNGGTEYKPLRVIDFLKPDTEGIEDKNKFYYIDTTTNELVTCSCVDSAFNINDIIIESGGIYKRIPFTVFDMFMKDIFEYTQFRSGKLFQSAAEFDITEFYK